MDVDCTFKIKHLQPKCNSKCPMAIPCRFVSSLCQSCGYDQRYSVSYKLFMPTYSWDHLSPAIALQLITTNIRLDSTFSKRTLCILIFGGGGVHLLLE
jgi:hypothetical protein